MFQNKERGFLRFRRELPANRPVTERIADFEEFAGAFPPEKVEQQALRCMHCGVPFCHSGCPLANVPPEFHDALKNGDWHTACDMLHDTNNFPEFTGRVCPAPCETSCVLGINDEPVTIRFIEEAIAERGWQKGWIKPLAAETRTGRRVAVVGSGPCGLAAAQQLARAGHAVTVYERDEEPGGLLTYGIPNFKLAKGVVQRRIGQLRAEGVELVCNAGQGKGVTAADLAGYDAVLLAVGSTAARDLRIPGRELEGIHFATDFLAHQNRRCLGRPVEETPISAAGRAVVVIGGGDTGSDCVGTALRQGARTVWSLELLPRPPSERDHTMLWPDWPMILRTSTSHEEGGERDWSVLTKEFLGENGRVSQLRAVRVEWSEPDTCGRRSMREVPDSGFSLDCDLVLLALGFLHPEHGKLLDELHVAFDKAGNIQTDARRMTRVPGVFAAGDARRGQSLVVWAIREGREAAQAIDEYLMGTATPESPRREPQ